MQPGSFLLGKLRPGVYAILGKAGRATSQGRDYRTGVLARGDQRGVLAWSRPGRSGFLRVLGAFAGRAGGRSRSPGSRGLEPTTFGVHPDVRRYPKPPAAGRDADGIPGKHLCRRRETGELGPRRAGAAPASALERPG